MPPPAETDPPKAPVPTTAPAPPAACPAPAVAPAPELEPPRAPAPMITGVLVVKVLPTPFFPTATPNNGSLINTLSNLVERFCNPQYCFTSLTNLCSLVLEDIAAVTGGTLISPTKGMKLDRFNMEWFGNARTVTVGKETTTIVDGKGNTEAIDARISELKSQIDQSNSPYEIERLQDRLAKMIGGVAIINVGGGTEIEMKEKKDRIDDALQATKAALEEGILPGAGVALLNARNSISNRDNSDFGKGGQIVFKACSSPLQQILSNAGEDYHQWASHLDKAVNNKVVPNIGEERLVDAFEAGIIDPTKVVRCALENAAAAAVTLLMTECVIHDKPNEKKKDEFDMSGLGM